MTNKENIILLLKSINMKKYGRELSDDGNITNPLFSDLIVIEKDGFLAEQLGNIRQLFREDGHGTHYRGQTSWLFSNNDREYQKYIPILEEYLSKDE